MASVAGPEGAAVPEKGGRRAGARADRRLALRGSPARTARTVGHSAGNVAEGGWHVRQVHCRAGPRPPPGGILAGAGIPRWGRAADVPHAKPAGKGLGEARGGFDRLTGEDGRMAADVG